MDDVSLYPFYLIITILAFLFEFVSSIFLFKKAKIPIWKAFIPIYRDFVAYKAVGMSGLWLFSDIPYLITAIPGLRIPVWLTGLTTIIKYGVDILFAFNLTRAFHRKWTWILPTLVFPTFFQLLISLSKKSIYDQHFNRYKYRKIGTEYVKLKDVKKARAKLYAETEANAKKEILSEPEPPEKTGILKKITDLIVEKHKIVLIVILLLTAFCGYLATRVNINRDLTKYMPESSETSQGLNIMYDEFNDVLAMPLSVMVNDLSPEEKQTEKKYLETLPGVSTLTYNDSEEYNKDNHTLYELTISGKADSDNAAATLKTIQNHYAETHKKISIRGEVATMNSPVLPIWVIVIAVVSALIILIIMSTSYVEPVMYLLAIGLAVVINMGTNALLPSVSQITNSITAVLQLALSMDYSIMLATEFHREKIKGKDKISAMKAALSRSFTAISASSITTIVGMLVLLLMSFTIGRDLGIVLAKGVLLCLLSIFTALPALLIIFDGLIEKTKKHAFSPNLSFLGNLSYKIRKFSLPIFLVIMGGSFIIQMQVGNLYTNTDSEAIDDIFGPYNQTVLVYDKADEAAITDFCKNTEKNPATTSVLCYGNTINDPQPADKLLDKFASLGTKVDISNELIHFIYYHYYDKDETHQLSLAELVSFLQNDAKNSELLSSQITNDTLSQIDTLAQFVYQDNLNRWRSLGEISTLLNIPYANLDELMVLYDAYQPNSTTLTLRQFSDFIKNNVVASPAYASEISSDMLDKLDLLDLLLNIADKLGAEAINKLDSLNIDIDKVLENFDITPRLKNRIKILLNQGRFVFVSAANQTKLTAAQLSQNLNIDRQKLDLLYSLYNHQNGISTKGLSLSQLINFLNANVVNSSFASRLSSEQAAKISAITNVINEANNPHSATDLHQLLSPLSDQITADKLSLLAIFHGATKAYPANDEITMAIEQVVNFLDENILKDARLETTIDDGMRQKVATSKIKINSAKDQLVAKSHGRVVIRSKLPAEGEETFNFVGSLKDDLASKNLTQPAYLVGNSPMAYEMSQSFKTESIIITIVTAIAIYVVVAISFESLFIPLLLVAIIQTAVWITMSITGLTDGSIYFLSLIIVQSLLMGATIDYAIMFTEQYVAARENNLSVHQSVIRGYNKSIQAILTSAGVLTIVTAIVGNFASSTAAKICKSISDGTFFSTILILLLLPALTAFFDKLIIRRHKKS